MSKVDTLRMVRLAAVSAMAAVVFFGCKKGDGTAKGAALPATAPVPGAVVVLATLEEVPGEFPANDIYNYAYIMRYRVDSVLQGSPGAQHLLVGHYNPRLPREGVKDDQDGQVGGNVTSFTAGDRHYLVLDPIDQVWQGAVEDEYYKDASARYWAKWADRI